jgi:hypothetical protein
MALNDAGKRLRLVQGNVHEEPDIELRSTKDAYYALADKIQFDHHTRS